MLTDYLKNTTKYITKGVYRQEEYEFCFNTDAKDPMRYKVILKIEMPDWTFEDDVVRMLNCEIYLKWGVFEEFLTTFDIQKGHCYKEKVKHFLRKNNSKIIAKIGQRFDEALIDYREAQKFFMDRVVDIEL